MELIEDAQQKQVGERKIARVCEEHSWLEPEILLRIAGRMAIANESRATRYAKLTAVADRVNETLAPVVACRKGCDKCCSMTTMLYEHEARAISSATGRVMQKLPAVNYDAALIRARKHYGRPCPFLKDGECSIYAVRPLVCRLHHSLNDDSSACDTSVAPERRKAAYSYDVNSVEVPYHWVVREGGRLEAWGAIQEFFPDD